MHKYQILDIIDEGAYGIVWKALNKQNQEFVAIKQFKETDEDEENKKTIQRQIKMLKMLKGDFVVGIREAFKKKGKVYLIFQFFPKNLLNVIEVFNQGLEASLINTIVYKIVKCLKFFHNKNIIHRDIKPENILLNEQNNVLKLCDLGFARFIPQNLKQMTDYVATRWYRSPQLLVGQPYGKASDMFALGCMIGQLVDGQPMFPGEDQVDQIFLLKKSLGDLTPNQYKCLFANHKFSGVEIPQIRKKQTLQERYLGKIDKKALSFMKACLKMNPQQRITSNEALKHPYLIQLSMKDNQFDNDQQNLLDYDRKTIAKNESRASILSISKIEDESKYLEQSVTTTKQKSNSKQSLGNQTRMSYGSVSYQVLKRGKNVSNMEGSSQMLKKKASYNVLTKPKHSSPDPINKTRKNFKKGIDKYMSQQKHLKVNLDVNVNINLKMINKKSQVSQAVGGSNNHNKYHIAGGNNAKSNKLLTQQKELQEGKLPQLKNYPKGYVCKNKGSLVGLHRKIGEKGNLGIYGQSKEISHQHLLNKKLGHLAN